MAASRSDISNWFNEGVSHGATHMIVVCDTYDWDDYPVYVNTSEDVHERVKNYNAASMQTVMEVYLLDLARKDEQMALTRSWTYA